MTLDPSENTNEDGDSKRSIVVFGDYDPEYNREKTIIRGLQLMGTDVRECRLKTHLPLNGPVKVLFLWYIYIQLWWKMTRLLDDAESVDAVLVMKNDLLMIPLAAVFARRSDCLLVYDVFVSMSRTGAIRDRPWVIVQFTYALEWLLYRLPDRVLVPTKEFAELYAHYYSIPPEKFVTIPISADETQFYPLSIDEWDQFTVLYWGNFLPHHGLDTVVEAAHELRDDPVDFVFIGEGPEYERIQQLVEKQEIPDVDFRGRVPIDELRNSIAAAHVCLGLFSSDPRARASVTNKVCEGLAIGRPIITRRSPPIKRRLDHKENVFLVPPESPTALADAINELRVNPDLRTRIANQAKDVNERSFSTESIGRMLINRIGLDYSVESVEDPSISTP